MKRITSLVAAFAAALCISASQSGDTLQSSAPLTPARHTDATGISIGKLFKQTDFSIKFGGYVIGRYSATDNHAKNEKSSFDLRFVRLYLNGYSFKDFYYRLQMEMNDAPGTDKGPRIVDAFVEWQRFEEIRVKLGQFKRPFGFENPYSPLVVGHGSYSQASLKLASINDRCGEHKSSGRDVGVQIQGDLFPVSAGHRLLHYQVGLFNGQGINHKERDNHKDLIGGLWFCPIKDLAIGAFGWNGRYTNERYKGDGTDFASVNRIRWGTGLKYESDWTVRGEYMSSVGGITTDVNAPRRSDAWYATIGVPVVKRLKIYGRWDCYRAARTWNSLLSQYTATANYNLGKNLIFQLGYTYSNDRSGMDKHYNTLDLQVYARF